MELLSQETAGMIDTSRMIIAKGRIEHGSSKDENDKDKGNTGVMEEEEKCHSWTTYEAYNIILHKWTKALCNLGASSEFQITVLRLWACYLRQLEVAFLPPSHCSDSQRPKTSFLPNKRDLHVLQHDQISVSPKSSSKGRKRKSLDKLKEKKRKRMTKSGAAHEKSDCSVPPPRDGSLPSGPRSSVLCAGFVHNWLKNRNSIHDPSHSSFDEDSDCEKDDPQKSIYTSESISSSKKSRSSICRSQRSGAGSVHSAKNVSSTWYSRKYQASLNHSQKRKLREKNPMHLSFNKLLPLLYLAVLLSKEDILLMDIIRWCREDHIPFLSAQYLLPASMPLCYSDKVIFKSNKHVPDAEQVQELVGHLALFLNIQKIPLPPVEDVLTKLIKTLNLPESIGNVAQELCTRLCLKSGGQPPSSTTMGLPPVECLAAAGVVIALKLFCGLNGLHEHQLSFVAEGVEKEGDAGPQGQPETSSLCHLFSWHSWHRHMCRVMWLCGKVDPVSSEHFHSLIPSQPRTHTSLFTRYHWSQAIWTLPLVKVNKKKKEILETMTNKILEAQGKSLNEMIAIPVLYQASHLPFISIMQQFVNQFHQNTEPEIQDLIKIGKEILNKSFTFHSVDWFDKLPHLQEQLRVQGSKMKVYPAWTYKKTVHKNRKTFKVCEDPTNSSSPTHIFKNIKKCTHFVPQPLEMSWMISDIIGSKWRTRDWNKLPANFRWLVSLVSRVCDISERQVIWMAIRLEKLTI